MADIVKLLLNIPNLIQSRLSFIITDSLPWKNVVLGASWALWGFQTFLTLRQYPNFSKTKPPKALEGHFEQEKFAASQRYGKDKAIVSIWASIYEQIIDTSFIYFDAYPWFWSLAGSALVKLGFNQDYQILHSVIFGSILFFAAALPSLPVSLYKTFVLEEKHGFNKSTLRLFITDTLKGWVVMGVLGIPFLSAFLWIIKWAGESFIPYLMTFFVVFQLIMVIIYPLFIQPLFNKFSPIPEGTLKTRIETLATKLKFPLKHLYVIDGSTRSSHSNAYFYGLPWAKHIVIYDTLINKTSEEGIEAVLAHELGHWHFAHPTKLLLISQIHLYAQLSLFPPFLKSPPLLRSFGFSPQVAANPPILVAFMLFQMVVAPMDAVISAVMKAITRHFEWQADRFACELDEPTASADGKAPKKLMADRLSEALISLHVENLSTVWVDWLYSAYHNSHPTLTERLKAMDDFKAERATKQK